MQKEINKRITYYRKKKNLTQSAVAQMLGMKTSAYSQAEREGNISCKMAIKLSEIFNIDIKQLLYEKPEKEEERLLENFKVNLDLEDLPNNPFPILTMDGYETQLLTMFKNSNENKQKVMMQCVYSIYKSNI